MIMKIFFGSDHAGFRLKNRLKRFVAALGYEPVDAGSFELDKDDDYPDFVIPAVRAAVKTGSRAIVLGGSGIGECIAANKVRGGRAALAFDAYTARMARVDNDANALCLGGRTSLAKKGVAEKIVRIFLTTKFSGAKRHRRRLTKISALER